LILPLTVPATQREQRAFHQHLQRHDDFDQIARDKQAIQPMPIKPNTPITMI